MQVATVLPTQVRNRGYLVKAMMQHVIRGIAIQLETATPIDSAHREAETPIGPGVIWWSNEDVAQRTKGRTTHALHHCAYAARRCGIAIHRGYDVFKARPGSEAALLKEDIEAGRDCVEMMLSGPLYSAAERGRYRQVQLELALEYGTKRNQHKRRASTHFANGTQATDRTGRNNPGASAMRTGAAIGHLIDRDDDIPNISLLMDRRTIYLHRLIKSHLELHHELEKLLTRLKKCEDDGDITRWLADSASANKTKRSIAQRAFRAMAQRFDNYAISFGVVEVKPFRGRARLISDLLKRASGHAVHRRIMELSQDLASIRQLNAWTMRLDQLHNRVLQPLALVLGDMERDAKVAKRKHLKSDVTKFLPHILSIDDALEQYVTAISVLPKEQAAANNDLKPAFLTNLRNAQAEMFEKNWLEAKQHLELAAAQLS